MPSLLNTINRPAAIQSFCQFSPLHPSMERVMGIEPTCPAWKAGALPLSYTRPTPVLGYQPCHQNQATSQLRPIPASTCGYHNGGGGRIRTYVDVRRQIYSLLPLTTRPPLRLKICKRRSGTAHYRNSLFDVNSNRIAKKTARSITTSSGKPFQVVDLLS